MKKHPILGACVTLAALCCAGALPLLAADRAQTPAQLVATYDSLADTILGAHETEWNLVHSILAMTYRHAEGTFATAKAKMAGGADARAEVELLAALVAQLANEGDASVAAVRKRLVEGGHHHNAAGEQQGIYEEGFVIVTREAKKGFLEAANKIGRLAGSKDAAALETAWKPVGKLFEGLHARTGS